MKFWHDEWQRNPFVIFCVCLVMHTSISLGQGELAENEGKLYNAGQAQRGNNDLSMLPQVVRDRIQQLDNKYSAAEFKNYSAKNSVGVEAMGNSKVVIISNEKYLYQYDLLKKVFYRDDLGDGFELSYYANGGLNNYIEYKAGKIDGVVVKFHRNGKLATFMECRDDNLTGVISQWDESGASVDTSGIQSPVEFIINVSTNN